MSKAVDQRLALRSDIVPLTITDVLTVTRVHENDPRADGRCYEHRSNGRVQTWKTRPGMFRWPVKYGLNGYGSITEINVHHFHNADTCPVQ